MSLRASDIAELGFQVGDHVCAFYNGGGNSLDGIIVDYVSKGLRAGNKCVCMIDTASSVRDRIPGELVSRDGILQFLTEDEAYLPEGYFSKDTFIRKMEATVKEAFSDGYDRFRAVGDVSFIVRNAVDIKTWFAAESELNKIAPQYPHFLFCLYNLDLFDGETVMYVLRTHPRIFVNGLIITNPYYIPTRQFLGNL
jgi:MEDS: MEthanogen/methylotroph, DcmR Sensory domain